MCGLVAQIGHYFAGANWLFNQLMYVTALRGHDSTGIMMGKHAEGTLVFKEMGTAGEHLSNIQKTHEDFAPSWVVGHCRYATRGMLNIEAAHPFDTGNNILVHNGTLDHIRFEDKNIDIKDFVSDSEALAHCIEYSGIEYTWQNMWGAAAIIWYDKKEQTLSFLRNEERPLYWTKLTRRYKGQANTVTLFGSELWMLLGIAQRNAFEIENSGSTVVNKMISINFKDKDKFSLVETTLQSPTKRYSETLMGANFFKNLTGNSGLPITNDLKKVERSEKSDAIGFFLAKYGMTQGAFAADIKAKQAKCCLCEHDLCNNDYGTCWTSYLIQEPTYLCEHCLDFFPREDLVNYFPTSAAACAKRAANVKKDKKKS